MRMFSPPTLTVLSQRSVTYEDGLDSPEVGQVDLSGAVSVGNGGSGHKSTKSGCTDTVESVCSRDGNLYCDVCQLSGLLHLQNEGH